MTIYKICKANLPKKRRHATVEQIYSLICNKHGRLPLFITQAGIVFAMTGENETIKCRADCCTTYFSYWIPPCSDLRWSTSKRWRARQQVSFPSSLWFVEVSWSSVVSSSVHSSTASTSTLWWVHRWLSMRHCMEPYLGVGRFPLCSAFCRRSSSSMCLLAWVSHSQHKHCL